MWYCSQIVALCFNRLKSPSGKGFRPTEQLARGQARRGRVKISNAIPLKNLTSEGHTL